MKRWGLVVAAMAMLGVGVAMAARAPIEVKGVHEVCLVGTADLEFWKARLAPEGLRPYLRDGRPELMICAYDSRWMGVQFREAILSVFTSDTDGGGRDGAYLVAALNSRKGFAKVEQKLNRSPYRHGEVSAERGPVGPDGIVLPSSLDVPWIRLSEEGTQVLEAHATRPLEKGKPGLLKWDGFIYLPTSLDPEGGGERYRVQLEGPAMAWPFEADAVLTLPRESGSSGFGVLSASHFQPLEWWLRDNGTHRRFPNQRR